MKRLLLVFLTVAASVLVTFAPALAATPDASGKDLRQLTLADGLCGTTVTNLTEDPLTGYVWIGTSGSGVNLYNGHRLLTFALPLAHDSLPNFCYQLAVAPSGDLWAATKGGLYRLRRYSDRFEAVAAADIDMAECLLPLSDRVYVGNRKGLFVVDERGRCTAVATGQPPTETNQSVRSIVSDGQGHVWLTTRNGISRLTTASGRVDYYALPTPSGLSHVAVAGRRLFVGTKNNGLLAVEVVDGKCRAQTVEAVTGSVVTEVRLLPDGHVGVATDGSGAFVIDVTTCRQLEAIAVDGPWQLPSNAAYTFLRTRRGIDFIGLYQHGLFHSVFSYPLFHRFETPGFTGHGVSVSGVFFDAPFMLVASGSRLYRFNLAEGTAPQSVDLTSYNMHTTKALERQGDSYVVGSYDGGAAMLSRQLLQPSRFATEPMLSYASVTSLTHGPGGTLWMATSEGLFELQSDGRLRNLNERNSKLPRGISNLCFDPQGIGWIGSAVGSCQLMPDGQTIRTEGFTDDAFRRLPSVGYVLNDTVIYALRQNQIYYAEPPYTHFQRLPLPAGVVDEWCLNIAFDATGGLWLVTEKGLFRMEGTDVRHFGAMHGLQGSHVNGSSLTMDSHRRLWVGTDDGLFWLRTDSLTASSPSSQPPRIGIDQANEGSKLWSPGGLLLLNDSRRMSIGWNLTTRRVTLLPAVNDFTAQADARYEWRLDGSEAWQLLPGGRSTVVLPNLLPGRHRLQLRLMGQAETTTDYTVDVLPTPLFYVELALLVIALGLLLWWRRWRKATKQLLQEHRETENALIEEMSQTAAMKLAGADDMAVADASKYSRSRAADKELAAVAERMDDYVTKERPFLDKELKMSDIAAHLGVSPSLLSQVFTLYLKEPYYDYINKKRLEEFKRLILAGAHNKYTLTALSELCGFKKTSFFSTFRKIEGITPTEWIERSEK